jgi:hypothetical protein
VHETVLGAGAYPALQVQNDRAWLAVVSVFEYCGHDVQADDACPAYVPMPHVVQVDDAVAATTADAFPGAHDVHVALPFDGLYVPVSHATQGSEAGSRYPATFTSYKYIEPEFPLMMYKYWPCRAWVHVTESKLSPAGHATFEAHSGFSAILANGSMFPTRMLKLVIFRGSKL